jgi:hypothetical protein
VAWSFSSAPDPPPGPDPQYQNLPLSTRIRDSRGADDLRDTREDIEEQQYWHSLWLQAGRQAVHVGDGDGERRVALAA